MKIRQQENRRETDVRRADDILTDNILTDDILRDALSDANLIRYAGAVSEETEPVYSERYRKKIAALLNRRDIQRYASRKSTAAFRRTVTGAACILMTFFIVGAGVLLINPSAQAAASRFLTELNENFATRRITRRTLRRDRRNFSCFASQRQTPSGCRRAMKKSPPISKTTALIFYPGTATVKATKSCSCVPS